MINELILYQSEGLSSRIDVLVENETVWLNRLQMASLFDRDVKTIGKHINNIFLEGELNKTSVVANIATTALDGKVYQTDHYSLDVIISAGYRVKSKQGTQFRIWATNVLKDYLLKVYVLNNRVNTIEEKVNLLIKKMDGIDVVLNANLPPNQGVFFNGQTYDAYDFVNSLIRKAKSSIVLIDNYIDDTVITQLTKMNKNVAVTLLSKSITKTLQLDIDKANSQYPTFKTVIFTKAHDRFMIIDTHEVYHLGASLKDLGKKWFAFSKLEADSVTIVESIKELI